MRPAIALTTALIFLGTLAYGQCPVLTTSNTSFTKSGICAPVDVFGYTARYEFLNAQNPADIVIRFEWNDPANTIDDFPAPAIDLTNMVFEATGTITYPGDNCEYVPTVSLIFQGDVCETASQTVVVWDREDSGGGNLAINPNPANVCEESAFTVEFVDTSRLNCDADFESPAVANGDGRHTQFVYGTNTGLANIDRIKGLSLVDGGGITVDLTEPDGAYTGGTTTINGVEGVYFGPVVANLPPPLVADPNNIAFPISAAADLNNVAGNTFQVTLYNWNACNPYVPDGFGNPNYADAISINATITLVGAPNPDFNVENDLGVPNPALFCINENVNVVNNTGPGPYDYNWVLYDGNMDTDPRIGDTIRLVENPIFTFPTGGQKLIRLIASRNDIGPDVDNTCQFISDRVITVSPDAVAGFEFFDPISGLNFDPVFCQVNPGDNFDIGIRDTTTLLGAQVQFEFYNQGNPPIPGNFPNSVTPATPSAINIPDFTVNYSGEQFVIVRLVATGGTGCTSIAQDTIFIYGQPLPDFTANEVCEGSRTEFTGIADPIGGLATRINDDQINLYEWDFSYDGVFNVELIRTDNSDFNWYLDGTDIATGVEPTTSAPGTYTVALRVTTEKGGCTDLITRPVTVNENPDAQVSHDAVGDVCPGDIVTFNNDSNNPGLPGTTYSLELTHPPSGFVLPMALTAVSTPIILTNPDDTTRTYQAQIRAESADGCFTFSNVETVRVSPDEEAQFNDPSYIFFNTNCSPWNSTMIVDAATQALAADLYRWTLLDENGVLTGYPIVKNSSDATFNELDYEIINTTSTIMNYTMVLEAEKAGVCITNDTVVVQISPQPLADFTFERTEDCDRVNFSLEATQKGLANYDWTFNPVPDATFGGGDSFMISYNREVNTGNDINAEIRLVTTNLASCQSDPEILNQTIEKQRPPNTVDFTLSTTTLQLPQNTVTITNNSTTGAGLTYDWNFGDGSTFSGYDPVSHAYNQFGTYEITLSVTDDFCTIESTQVVTVLPTAPILEFEADTLEGCAPLTVQFTNLSQFATPGEFLWEFGDGSISRSDNPTHTFFAGGNFTVRLRGTNEVGTNSEIEKREYISVYARPFADFLVSTRVVYIPDQEAIFKNLSENASTYLWDFGDGDTSTDSDPRHAYSEEGFYDITLIATNDLGCVDTLFRSAEVQAISGGQVSAPNAFTPSLDGPSGGIVNGNGSDPSQINDVFLPRLEGVERFRMFIYNKWGELIFESNSQDRGWDGYYQSKLAPSGAYVYKLELRFSDGRDIIKVGDVTLIR